MHTDGMGLGRIAATALAVGVMLNGNARAQCGVEVTAGLRFPLGIALSNQNNLLISESGTAGVLHSGRISILGTDGTRRTLLDGLPSGSNDVGDSSGPAGLVMRGRTLYVAIGIGDAIQPLAPGSPVTVANPRPSSPIFSSVLGIHFSAHVERATAGFSLTLTDYDALADGQTVKLANGTDEITIELVANFPDFVPNPLPTVPNSVRGSNPFDLELIGDQLYVTDGGRNVVWQADIHTGAFAPLAAFDPIPNPTGVGAPVLEAVPTGIREFEGQLFVTLFRGFPFPPGASVVERIDPGTGVHAPILVGLRSAIDVLVGDDEHTSLFVLEHGSGALLPPFSGPGSLTRRDAAGSTMLANCLARPTSMVRDERSGAFYITELVNGRVVKVP
jgi:hypothetical protein